MKRRSFVLAQIFFAIAFGIGNPVAQSQPTSGDLFEFASQWDPGSGSSPNDLLRLLVGSVPGEAAFEVTLPGLQSGALGLKLLRIPAGTFLMGASDTDPQASEEEQPQHPVSITRDFYLGETEITQAQYLAVMGAFPQGREPAANIGVGPDIPVYNVSWIESQLFIDALNSLMLVPGTFRLPTEAEWEYGARGETTTRFWWGEDTACYFDGGACEANEYAW